METRTQSHELATAYVMGKLTKAENNVPHGEDARNNGKIRSGTVLQALCERGSAVFLLSFQSSSHPCKSDKLVFPSFVSSFSLSATLFPYGTV